MPDTDEDFMRAAIQLSLENMANGGGPFGAVVVLDGKIVGRGGNRVTEDNDPTAHAEVSAIREACRVLGRFSLAGATIYTSCEPCPMCLAAIYWARLDRMVYGNSRQDAAEIGFDDAAIYEQVSLPVDGRSLPTARLLPEEAVKAFRAWADNPDKVPY